MPNVTSWFVDQLTAGGSSPIRTFTMGGSDYTTRVKKWGTIKRTALEVNPPELAMSLANNDGEFNNFYADRYTMVQSATLQIGFTHPTSGDEFLVVYSGYLKKIRYTGKQQLEIRLQDKFWELQERVVGTDESPVQFTDKLVSEVVWTLITCYGQFDSATASANLDINYDDGGTSFLNYALQFSQDTVLISAEFRGEKVSEALSAIVPYTDSVIWHAGNGKLQFDRFTEATSLGLSLTADQLDDLQVDLDDSDLTNKNWVYGNYDVDSKGWFLTVNDESSSSVNTYGLRENVLKSPLVWYVNTASALNQAQRRSQLYSEPPRSFIADTTLVGVYRDLAETVNLVDDFLGITSADNWRIVEKHLNMDNGSVRFNLDGAVALDGFYLDITSLDGDERLL